MAFHLAECLLLSLLKRKNINQAEFARRMKVSRQYIRKLIIKESTMTFEFAINAASVLDCEITDLYVIKFVSNRIE